MRICRTDKKWQYLETDDELLMEVSLRLPVLEGLAVVTSAI